MENVEAMARFTVPGRGDVSPANQAIFDHMEKAFGKVPNLYATFAWNETALGDYLALQNRRSTLTAKEREVINLVVSQVNECRYCVPAHTAVAQMHGFSEEEVLAIRKGKIGFNEKLQALAMLVKETVINRGRPSEKVINAFFDAGYTKSGLIDVMIVIGDKTISNYLHNIIQIPVDWPEVPAI